jgi:hypothetical protein
MAADETHGSEPSDTSAQPSPHIRLRVDLVVEIADAAALTRSALDHVARDELMPDEERAHAEEIISGDAGEALACLVDPFDLVRELPGVELAHASWGSEEMDADDLDAFSFLDGAEGLDEHDEHDERDERDEPGDPAGELRGEAHEQLDEDFRGGLDEDFHQDLDGVREDLHGLDGVRR